MVACVITGAESKAQSPRRSKAERVIRANRFLVEDENGKPRVTLTVSKDGPKLILMDKKPRATLGVNKDGPVLDMLDENGKTSVMMSVTKDAQMLIMMDENDKIRAGLSMSKDETKLGLYDENGKVEFVVLPYEEFLALQERLEDVEDLLELRRAKLEDADEPGIPLEAVMKRFGLTDEANHSS